jgi:4-hydroxy-3-polyprenylbenzoate decarboxylase
MRRIVVGMSGSSGAIYGIRMLETLAAVPDVETHLIMSKPAKTTVTLETDWAVPDVEALADVVHDRRDVAASIASGSFKTEGMVVAPCSIKTLSSIANSYNDNLLSRAADVVLKEHRRLVLLIRETPLHVGHCRLLLDAATMGAVLMPPVPSFYNRPETIDDLVNQTVGRALDHFEIESGKTKRWSGDPEAEAWLTSSETD